MIHGAELAAGHHVSGIDFANLPLWLSLALLLSDLLHGERMHLRNLGLDLLELRTVLAVSFPRIFTDCLPNQLYPVPRIRVVAQKLRPARSTFFFELGEKFDHGERVIAGVVHDLRTKQVGFTLGVARIF